MSGPKDYCPPPAYSIHVFDGQLNKVFQLQSRLKMVCAELENLQVSDTKTGIQFDCLNELNAIRQQIESALQAMVFVYKGTFGQNTYNKLDNEIKLRISELLELTNKCELIKDHFEQQKRDYTSFLAYLSFYDNAILSFNDFKTVLISYLRDYLKASEPDLFDEATNRISIIELTRPASTFSEGFDSRFDSEKKMIVDHIVEKENIIHSVRTDISDKVIAKLQDGGGEIRFINPSKKSNGKTTLISDKIKMLILHCDDASMKRIYQAEFDTLAESSSLKDTYFYIELHDSILEKEKTRKKKVLINDILSLVNTSVFHSSTHSERQNIITKCLMLLNNTNITQNEYDDIQFKLEQLKKDSSKCFEDEEIKNKERHFLKSQLIHCLENQGYEVMDDMKVIDFEKEDDFLLKINKQENYLNLKFKEDGSMRYVFQIPENVDDLSTDQKTLKLHEMEVTCSEFKSVLSELSMMGLQLTMRSEKPVEFNSLVSVTKSGKEKLKTRSKNLTQNQQEKKKYLN